MEPWKKKSRQIICAIRTLGRFFGCLGGFVGDDLKLPSFFGGDFSHKLMK